MGPIFLFYLSVFLIFSIPLLPALLELWQKKDATPLKIIREYDGNINYFAQIFRQFVAQNFTDFLHPSVITKTSLQYNLQDGSAFQIVGEDGLAIFSISELSRHETQQIIIAKSGFKAPNKMFFTKEVYSPQDISGENKLSFRAILADGDIILGEECTIIRWVHSKQNIRLGQGAKIYGRMSAEKEIQLDVDSRFGRMHAPIIYFGGNPTSDVRELVATIAIENATAKTPLSLNAQILDESANRWLARGNYKVGKNTQHGGSLVAQMDLLIGANCHIAGSIKSSGDLHLGDCCVIDGAVVAEGAIYIGRACRIKGPIIGEKKVQIRSGTVVGAPELPTTITAPRLRISSGVIAHGAVWAREMGYVAAPALDKKEVL